MAAKLVLSADKKIPLILSYTSVKKLYDEFFPHLVDGPSMITSFDQAYWYRRELFEQTLFDRDAVNRQSLLERWEHRKAAGTQKDFLADFLEPGDMPTLYSEVQVLPLVFTKLGYSPVPEFTITEQEMRRLLEPFLLNLKKGLLNDELYEQNLIWSILTRGYLIPKQVFKSWLNEFESSSESSFPVPTNATLFIITPTARVACRLLPDDGSGVGLTFRADGVSYGTLRTDSGSNNGGYTSISASTNGSVVVTGKSSINLTIIKNSYKPDYTLYDSGAWANTVTCPDGSAVSTTFSRYTIYSVE